MTLRAARVRAIAARDLAMELRGRRGWVLPAVMAGLLGPAAAAPVARLPTAPVAVRGDVPAEVAAVVPVRDRAPTVLRRDESGAIAVRGPIPAEVRRALDGDAPVVRVVDRGRTWPVPGRTALLALIASSTLTGAIASAIPGERAARTLPALLSASVSRGEIVVGKWLAWGGLGAAASVLAAAVAVIAGRVPAGPWILALPWVPLGTVAFGLWLVRSAGDALSGSTTSIRVVPAVVGGLALAAWGLGVLDPRLGPLVPVGGAVLAAGSTWGPGLAPALVAVGSTAVACAAWLAATARDLDESPAPAPWRGAGAVLAGAAIGAATSWSAYFPALWSAAGNPAYGAEISPGAPVWAAAALGAWAAAVGGARLGPVRTQPAGSRALFSVPLALVLALATAAPPGWGMPLAALLVPAAGPAGVALVLADELLYRVVLRRWLGTGGAAAAWTLARAPHDPILGLASGLGLGWLAESHWALAVAARVGWLAAAPFLPDVPGLGLAVVAAVGISAWRRASPPPSPAPAG